MYFKLHQYIEKENQNMQLKVRMFIPCYLLFLSSGNLNYAKSCVRIFQDNISFCPHLIKKCQKCVPWLRVGCAARMERQETSPGMDSQQKSRWCIALKCGRPFLLPGLISPHQDSLWKDSEVNPAEFSVSSVPHLPVLRRERLSQILMVNLYACLKKDGITFHYDMNHFLKPLKPLMHDKLILI